MKTLKTMLKNMIVTITMFDKIFIGAYLKKIRANHPLNSI